MLDRYKLSQFYQGKESEIPYANFQRVEDAVYSSENLQIVSLAMDFPAGTPQKTRKEIEAKWIETLPKLKNVKALSVRQLPFFFLCDNAYVLSTLLMF